MENDLEEGELILGDMGYIGEARIVTPRKRKPKGELSEDEKQYNALVGEERIVVEHTFSLLKSFHSMSHPWRNALYRHKLVFFVVCELVNLKKKSLY